MTCRRWVESVYAFDDHLHARLSKGLRELKQTSVAFWILVHGLVEALCIAACWGIYGFLKYDTKVRDVIMLGGIWTAVIAWSL
jgi:hypothetical protein